MALPLYSTEYSAADILWPANLCRALLANIKRMIALLIMWDPRRNEYFKVELEVW